jgi:hypothetical protein
MFEHWRDAMIRGNIGDNNGRDCSSKTMDAANRYISSRDHGHLHGIENMITKSSQTCNVSDMKNWYSVVIPLQFTYHHNQHSTIMLPSIKLTISSLSLLPTLMKLSTRTGSSFNVDNDGADRLVIWLQSQTASTNDKLTMLITWQTSIDNVQVQDPIPKSCMEVTEQMAPPLTYCVMHHCIE